MRAFLTPGGLFVWLPQAIMWSKAKSGSQMAMRRFESITKYWAQIGGWIFFFATLAASAVALYPDILIGIWPWEPLDWEWTTDNWEPPGFCRNIDYDNYGNIVYDKFGDRCSAYYGNINFCENFDDDDFESATMCCACGGGTRDETWTPKGAIFVTEYIVAAAVVLSIEIVGWIMFYISKKEAILYADSLIVDDDQDEEENEE